MELPINKIICGDCIEVMREWPDKCVDLVLTDPPYGINADREQNKAALQRIKADGNSKAGRGWKLYPQTAWDENRPQKQYFDSMIRISKISIIWGGNYFADLLPASMGWLMWDKRQRGFSLADGELAWTSERKALRIFDYSRAEALQDFRTHPTQKPVALGLWILGKYSKPDDLILDCYCGSGSFCVAAKMLGRRYIGIDISSEYCKIAQERLDAVDTGVPVKETRQGQMALFPSGK